MKELNAIYTPAQVAKRVDLSSSSIRRYTIALEKAGYPHIKRSANNHRRYDVYDMQVLKYFNDLVQEEKAPFDRALEQTIENLEYIKTKVDIGSERTALKDEQHSDINQLDTKINMLIEMVQDLNMKTESLQKDNERLTAYIEERNLSSQNEQLGHDLQSDVGEDDDNQTDIYDYIDESKEVAENVGDKRENDVIPEEKTGIFSRIKKWFN